MQGRAGEQVAPAELHDTPQAGNDLPTVLDGAKIGLLEGITGVAKGPGAVDAALGQFEGTAVDIGTD